jgi:6-phosphogluconate dehydrogenase (decarboxylating)
MQLGVVGLGRMGGNIARRLMGDGHSCVVSDKSADAVASLAGQGASEEAVPATVLSAAPYARFRSREGHAFADRLLSAMAKEFGGHIEAKGL